MFCSNYQLFSVIGLDFKNQISELGMDMRGTCRNKLASVNLKIKLSTFLMKNKIVLYDLKCKINYKTFLTKGFPKGGGAPFGKNSQIIP